MNFSQVTRRPCWSKTVEFVPSSSPLVDVFGSEFRGRKTRVLDGPKSVWNMFERTLKSPSFFSLQKGNPCSVKSMLIKLTTHGQELAYGWLTGLTLIPEW